MLAIVTRLQLMNSCDWIPPLSSLLFPWHLTSTCCLTRLRISLRIGWNDGGKWLYAESNGKILGLQSTQTQWYYAPLHKRNYDLLVKAFAGHSLSLQMRKLFVRQCQSADLWLEF